MSVRPPPNGTIQAALEAYDAEHEFAREVTLPEEDRVRFPQFRWRSGYRWFRTPNVVCLETVRRLKATGRIA
jgi:hypothetical protein